MAACRQRNVSYTLLERVSRLLICSRCFRRNVHQPLTRVFSRRHRILPLCSVCSGQLNPGHTARVIPFDLEAALDHLPDRVSD